MTLIGALHKIRDHGDGSLVCSLYSAIKSRYSPWKFFCMTSHSFKVSLGCLIMHGMSETRDVYRCDYTHNHIHITRTVSCIIFVSFFDNATMKTAFYYCRGCFTIHIIYIYFQSQEPGTFLGPKPSFCFFIFKSISIWVESIAKRQATHARLDTQDVVVDREQLLQGCLVVGLHLHGHLGVVNAREVASAGWLVLLRLQGE